MGCKQMFQTPLAGHSNCCNCNHIQEKDSWLLSIYSYCLLHKSFEGLPLIDQHSFCNCFWCGESFAKIKYHFQIGVSGQHSSIQEIKMHNCQMCNLLFSRKAHVKRHMERAHLKKKYSCDKCNFAAKKTQKPQRVTSKENTRAKQRSVTNVVRYGKD